MSSTLRAREAKEKGLRAIRNEEKAQDSDTSVQELQQKKSRSRRVRCRGAKYNEHGIHLETQLDLCDCLDVSCKGCYMPCPECKSKKCGHECRQYRTWDYDDYEIEGTEVTVKNVFKK